jgi:hypothetical protein
MSAAQLRKCDKCVTTGGEVERVERSRPPHTATGSRLLHGVRCLRMAFRITSSFRPAGLILIHAPERLAGELGRLIADHMHPQNATGELSHNCHSILATMVLQLLRWD